VTAQMHDHFTLDGCDYEIVGVSGEGWFEPQHYGLHPGGHIMCTGCWRGYVATYALQDAQLVLDELEINLQSPVEGTVDGEFPPALNGIKPWEPKEHLSRQGRWPDRRTIKSWTDMQAAEARRLGFPPDMVEYLLPDLETIRSWPGLEADLRTRLGIDLADPHTQKALYSSFEYIYENLGLELGFTGDLLPGQGFITELYVHMGFQRPWKYEKVLKLQFDRGLLLESRDVSDAMYRRRRVLRRLPLEPGPGVSLRTLRRWIEWTFSLDHTRGEVRWLGAAILGAARRLLLKALMRWMSRDAPSAPR
jgi:hypothetical protein